MQLWRVAPGLFIEVRPTHPHSIRLLIHSAIPAGQEVFAWFLVHSAIDEYQEGVRSIFRAAMAFSNPAR